MGLSSGSLFSGIGAFDLAMERCGHHIAWQCETDMYCRAVLSLNFPGRPIYGDIRHVDFEATLPVDLLFGGFPCQDVSSAGKRAGLAGDRSGLWREFDRAVRMVRPKIVFVENVGSGRSRYLPTVLGDLAGLGYRVEWHSLEAAEVGASQLRDRCFVLAYRDGDCIRQLAERYEQDASVGRDAEPGEHGEAVLQETGPVANRDSDGCEGLSKRDDDDRGDAPRDDAPRRSATVPFPPGPRDPADDWIDWFGRGGPSPGVLRGAYGHASGMDARRRKHRLHALGNSVVPLQAETAFRVLVRRAGNTVKGTQP